MSKKAAFVANALKRSKALKFGEFKIKSGILSPYYIDLSWLLSSYKDFRCIVDLVTEQIKPLVFENEINKLASIELKGALLLPSIANNLNMPCIIVRKESKVYGYEGRITGGEVKKGDRFILFDDVVSTGDSKIEGIKPIKKAGGEIPIILVVVDREQGGKEELEKRGYKVKALTTISEVATTLLSAGDLSNKKTEMILNYLKK